MYCVNTEWFVLRLLKLITVCMVKVANLYNESKAGSLYSVLSVNDAIDTAYKTRADALVRFAEVRATGKRVVVARTAKRSTLTRDKIRKSNTIPADPN